MESGKIDLIVQGDVFLFRSEIPDNSEKLISSGEPRVLAYGETTGHSHLANGDFEAYALNGILYLKVGGPAEITHEEHLPLDLPPGTWQVGVVREFDPFLEECKSVVD